MTYPRAVKQWARDTKSSTVLKCKADGGLLVGRCFCFSHRAMSKYTFAKVKASGHPEVTQPVAMQYAALQTVARMPLDQTTRKLLTGWDCACPAGRLHPDCLGSYAKKALKSLTF
jgi:hypothetical protein